MTELTVRCNSCSAENELYANEMPDEYEQYGKPHIDLPGYFSCCECGRYHIIGTSVELVPRS
jgi:hypothetical protein